MFNKKSITRFGKSFGVGLVTFALDLALLSLFIDVFHLYYVVAAGVAFVIATALNYVISRRYVFTGSERGVRSGYLLFLLIGGVGVLIITTLMYVLVDVFAFHYLISRILIAGVVGWWNYLMNLHVNFKVAGT